MKGDKNVIIRSQKVSAFIKLQKSYTKDRLGYKVPIGSLLVAAMEYISPALEAKELKIIRRGGNVAIVKNDIN